MDGPEEEEDGRFCRVCRAALDDDDNAAAGLDATVSDVDAEGGPTQRGRGFETEILRLEAWREMIMKHYGALRQQAGVQHLEDAAMDAVVDALVEGVCQACVGVCLGILNEDGADAEKELAGLQVANATASQRSMVANAEAQRTVSESLAQTRADTAAVTEETRRLTMLVASARAEQESAVHAFQTLCADSDRHWDELNRTLAGETESSAAAFSAGMREAFLRSELARVQDRDAWHDMFAIDTTTAIASINGFRLGQTSSESESVPWEEINMAWGECAVLLHILAKHLQHRSRLYQIRPLGCKSVIRSLKEHVPASGDTPEGRAERDFPLHGSDDLRFRSTWLGTGVASGLSSLGAGLTSGWAGVAGMFSRQSQDTDEPSGVEGVALAHESQPFDNGMKAFVRVLGEVVAAAQRTVPDLVVPYDVAVNRVKLRSDVWWSTPDMDVKLNNQRICMTGQTEETWTGVLRNLLEILSCLVQGLRRHRGR
jgi:Apg6 BARA domain